MTTPAALELLRRIMVDDAPELHVKPNLLDELYNLDLICVSRNGIHVTQRGKEAVRDSIINSKVKRHERKDERRDHR